MGHSNRANENHSAMGKKSRLTRFFQRKKTQVEKVNLLTPITVDDIQKANERKFHLFSGKLGVFHRSSSIKKKNSMGEKINDDNEVSTNDDVAGFINLSQTSSLYLGDISSTLVISDENDHKISTKKHKALKNINDMLKDIEEEYKAICSMETEDEQTDAFDGISLLLEPTILETELEGNDINDDSDSMSDLFSSFLQEYQQDNDDDDNDEEEPVEVPTTSTTPQRTKEGEYWEDLSELCSVLKRPEPKKEQVHARSPTPDGYSGIITSVYPAIESEVTLEEETDPFEPRPFYPSFTSEEATSRPIFLIEGQCTLLTENKELLESNYNLSKNIETITSINSKYEAQIRGEKTENSSKAFTVQSLTEEVNKLSELLGKTMKQLTEEKLRRNILQELFICHDINAIPSVDDMAWTIQILKLELANRR